MDKIILRLVDAEGKSITTLKVPASTTLSQLVRFVTAKREDLRDVELDFLVDGKAYDPERTIRDVAADAGLDLAAGVRLTVAPRQPSRVGAKTEPGSKEPPRGDRPFWRQEMRKALARELGDEGTPVAEEPRGGGADWKAAALAKVSARDARSLDEEFASLAGEESGKEEEAGARHEGSEDAVPPGGAKEESTQQMEVVPPAPGSSLRDRSSVFEDDESIFIDALDRPAEKVDEEAAKPPRIDEDLELALEPAFDVARPEPAEKGPGDLTVEAVFDDSSSELALDDSSSGMGSPPAARGIGSDMAPVDLAPAPMEALDEIVLEEPALTVFGEIGSDETFMDESSTGETTEEEDLLEDPEPGEPCGEPIEWREATRRDIALSPATALDAPAGAALPPDEAPLEHPLPGPTVHFEALKRSADSAAGDSTPVGPAPEAPSAPSPAQSDYLVYGKPCSTHEEDTCVAAGAPAPPAERAPTTLVAPVATVRSATGRVRPDAAGGGDAASVPDEITRRATVRYFRQMNPLRVFPLVVFFSEKKIAEVRAQEVAQVEAKRAIQVSEADPWVEIAPHFPGCLVTPERVRLSVKGKVTRTVFEITPLAEGTFDSARVEIFHKGEKVEEIATPTRVVKQTSAKVALAASFASPLLSTAFDALQLERGGKVGLLTQVFRRILEVCGGWTGLGLTLGGLSLAAALVLYLLRRPRQADPVRSMMEVDGWVGQSSGFRLQASEKLQS
ncbi:MAG: hypothetical protein HY720_04990 [Planctomycetes bacterium]|nr:hypothetical protein [Planctomycetota bacterium]